MTVQQWRKVDPICKAAARLKGADRTGYLDRRCRGNEELRQEVESQLAYQDRSSAFLGILSSGGLQKVAHYKVLERIGEGGMGHVFKALDTRLNRLVALKALPPWAASSPAARDLLLKEARFACSLNHPNIVTIYEILKQKHADYIVMEFLPGRTLKDVIPVKGLSEQDAVGYALAIADALTHAHAAGILHRDLKPSNILITDQGRVKLLDFGLAVPLSENKGRQDPKPAQAWGTSVYMAPEQFRTGSPDPRSDQFSFGIVLWEILTGNHPFGPGTSKEISEAILHKTFSSRSRKVSAPLVQVVSRCLEKEPLSRFQFMHEVHAALLAIDDSSGERNHLTQVASEFISGIPASRSAELRKARSAIALMNSESLTKCREGAETLRLLLEQNGSEELHTLVRRSMRDLILSVPRFKLPSVSAPVRAIRSLALDVHRYSSRGDLHFYFRNNDFEFQDLFEMDFSAEPLVGFHFNRSFLVRSTFKFCDLTDCTFEQSRIRNVDFAGANLSRVNLSGADWFNAINLTIEQIETVRHGSLIDCPADEAGFRYSLDKLYGMPFASWGRDVQQELQETWNVYLRPGGLGEHVRHLRLSLP